MSKHNDFFKPTLLYKEFMILDLIEKNAHITQREMALSIGVAVSMINGYIENFEELALIKRKKYSSKDVDYIITKKGLERRKLLNIWYLKSSYNVYLSAKNNIIIFLNQIMKKGFKKIVLYGAGEVAEIMLQVMNDHKQLPLNVVAVIDDNKYRVGIILINKPVITLNELNQYNHDGIMISSYTHQEIIHDNLAKINYPKKRIINFFDR